jgi:hypothetical protein
MDSRLNELAVRTLVVLGLTALVAAALLLAGYASDVLLLGFAGILLAIFLRATSARLSETTVRRPGLREPPRSVRVPDAADRGGSRDSSDVPGVPEGISGVKMRFVLSTAEGGDSPVAWTRRSSRRSLMVLERLPLGWRSPAGVGSDERISAHSGPFRAPDGWVACTMTADRRRPERPQEPSPG